MLRIIGRIAAAAVIFIAPAAMAATLTVNTNSDADSNTDGVLSLREAILLASGNMSHCISASERDHVAGATFVVAPLGPTCSIVGYMVAPFQAIGASFSDTIQFDTGATTIFPSGGLPLVAKDDKIAGYNGNQKVIIDGTSTSNAYGLFLSSDQASANELYDLEIRNFDYSGVYGVGIQSGRFLGLVLHDNGAHGLELVPYYSGDNATSKNPRLNQIGTNSEIDRNFIYSNGIDGIHLVAGTTFDRQQQGNTIANNYIGLDAGGATDKGNGQNGIYIENSSGNTIGGGDYTSRNTISGNNNDGIQLAGNRCHSNALYFNFIGTSGDGLSAIGNGASGVAIFGGAGEYPNEFGVGNRVGDEFKGNVISSNGGSGVYIGDSGTNGNIVQGNTIGLPSAGTADRGNGGAGVGIYNGPSGTIVGGAVNKINVIGYNDQGVDIGSATGNTVAGNLIGNTGLSGNVAVPNNGGVRIYGTSTGNTIGAIGTTLSNLISSNVYQGVGIYDEDADGNTVAGNFIGLNSAGNVARPNGENGIVIQNADISTITENYIGGNTGDGINITGADGTSITANKIGLELNEQYGVANTGNGIRLGDGAVNTFIDGLNAIGGNNGDGVQLNGAGVTGNFVRGNAIGLNTAQDVSVANGASGVAVYGGASGNTIGGTLGASTNLITASGYAGVYISDAATQDNAVRGNIIALNGGPGIGIFGGADGTTVGGPNFFNFIFQNGGPGIDIANAGTTLATIQNNRIGIDTGGAAKPNAGGGIRVYGGATDLLIGGPNAGDGNVISGNTGPGVGLYNTGTTRVTVQGNFIGSNSGGTAAIPNSTAGVVIQEGAAGNTVTGNLVGGNAGDGVFIQNAGTSNNAITANKIGVRADGTTPLGNGGNGVVLTNNASSNRVGGTAPGEGNIIGANGSSGVLADGGTGNAIRQNAISGNGALGIDLGKDGGVTENDASDSDTGANNLQNFPVLTTAALNGSNLSIVGGITTSALTICEIDFFASPACDASGNGEGKTYLGSASVSTNGSGLATINTVLSAAGTAGQVLTATASAANNTSEFSDCILIKTPTPSPTPSPSPTASPTPTPSPTSCSGRALGDFDCSGCTDLGDFLFLLDNWQLLYQGEVVGLNDFLALLDNWQLGPACP